MGSSFKTLLRSNLEPSVFKVPAEQSAWLGTPNLEDAGLAEARMAVRDQCRRG